MFVPRQLRRVRLPAWSWFRPPVFVSGRSRAVVVLWSLLAVLVSEFL